MNRLMIFFYILNLLNAETNFLIQEFNSRYKKNFIKKTSILYSENINIINLSPDGFIIISNHKNYSKIFKLATKQALVNFKGKKIKIGRARMFEDKTKDLDDPGMFAFNRLSEAF